MLCRARPVFPSGLIRTLMAFFDKPPADSSRPSLTGRLVEDVTEYIDTRLSVARLDTQASMRNALVGMLHG